MRREDGLDLERNIDPFVSAGQYRQYGSVRSLEGSLLIGKRLAICLSRYAVGIDRQNRVLCNGDMLESHGHRLLPRQLKLRLSSVSGPTSSYHPLWNGSSTWPVFYRELYGGTLYNTAET
jgi:hypothetical protein